MHEMDFSALPSLFSSKCAPWTSSISTILCLLVKTAEYQIKKKEILLFADHVEISQVQKDNIAFTHICN
jgi:hypothetical protein